jgi:hypothetical protein
MTKVSAAASHTVPWQEPNTFYEAHRVAPGTEPSSWATQPLSPSPNIRQLHQQIMSRSKYQSSWQTLQTPEVTILAGSL